MAPSDPGRFALSSMTGYARSQGEHDGRRWVWELRSVNARGLETRFRLPPGFDFVDAELRKIIGGKISRGSINATARLETVDQASAVKVNRSVLDAALVLIEEVRMQIECAPPTPEGILSLRGVLESVDADAPADEAERMRLGEALVDGFRRAVADLCAMRCAEGASLAGVLEAQITDVERLTGSIRSLAEGAQAAAFQRLAEQVHELLSDSGLPTDRLVQEAALLATKADIREELDRLAAHTEAARALLRGGGPVGRRLDFLTQEFNREANTLCAKVQDMAVKRLGLDLKSVIDQMREQVQNIE